MGALWGVSDAPVMPPIMGAVTDGPHDCKTTSNIDIYPSTLIFVENIGHNYDFEEGGVVSGRIWAWAGVAQIQRNK